MKLIMFLLLSHTVFATKYHVANSGNNSANGLTPATAWQTFSKVNGFSYSSGDSILLNRGDSWNEQLLPPRSNLYIGYYGTGNKPIIAGFKTATMSSIGGNLWTSTLSDGVINQNTILINGAFHSKGRYPNSSYLQTILPSTIYSVPTQLGASPNYAGGEIVLRTQSWITERRNIYSQVVDTFTTNGVYVTRINVLTPFLFTTPGPNQFFIQNLPSLCDVQDDWAYDSATKALTVYSTTLPTVQYSTIDTLVNVNGKDHITFDGITFQGANQHGIRFDNSGYINVVNSTFKEMGYKAMSGGVNVLNIDSDSFINILSTALYFPINTDSGTVNNCYFKNISKINGLSGSGDDGMAIFLQSERTIIKNNRIDTVGYNAIYWGGHSAMVYRNYITNYCLNQDDGGGIYSYGNYGGADTVRANIVLNGIGVTNTAAGLYADENATGILYDSNTVSNSKFQGVLIHLANSITFNDNTIMDSTGVPYWYSRPGSGGTFSTKRNIFYQKDSLRASMFYVTHFTGDNIDNNYYLNPRNPNRAVGYGAGFYTLAEWTALFGYDANSHITPTGITGAGTLYINPILSDTTIFFSGLYKDAKGAEYNNSKVLHPYQSTILFKASGELPAAAGAKRLGSLIFN